MRRELEFTPELGLFIFFVVVLAFFALGIIYRYIIALQGMTITSWWRSAEKNAAVGGVYNSLHLVGLAWDVIPVTQENENRLRSLGLKVINEGDHLHAQIA